MKNTNRITVVTLAAVAVLGSALVSFGDSASNEAEQSAEVIERAVSSPACSVDRRPVPQGDGVTSKVAVVMSDIFQSVESDKRLRVISYEVLWKDSEGMLIGHVFSQETRAEDSSEWISLGMTGLNPYLTADESPGIFHGYMVSIAPAVDKTWGTSETFEVRSRVNRTE